MNWAQFKKNIGMRVQLEPTACHLDAQGNELLDENGDWIVQSVSETNSVTLRNVRTDHVAELGKDHIYDFRFNPAQSKGGITYGFLVLKMQIFVQGNRLRLRPNPRPGERVGPPPQRRQQPMWTQFIKVNASESIPPSASIAKIQYRLWSDDPNVPLLIRIASEQNGKLMEELSGPAGVAEQMITEQQTLYVSVSHPRIRYEVSVLGYTRSRATWLSGGAL